MDTTFQVEVFTLFSEPGSPTPLNRKKTFKGLKQGRKFTLNII